MNFSDEELVAKKTDKKISVEQMFVRGDVAFFSPYEYFEIHSDDSIYHDKEGEK